MQTIPCVDTFALLSKCSKKDADNTKLIKGMINAKLYLQPLMRLLWNNYLDRDKKVRFHKIFYMV